MRLLVLTCCRMNSRAPKPNKGFLQHLIRQTDSHNAALLAKEAADSRARLRLMNREQDKAEGRKRDKNNGAEGRLTPVASDNNARNTTSSGRRDRSYDESRHKRRRGERERDDSKSASSRRYRDRSRDVHRRRSHDSEEEDRSRRKRRRSRSPQDGLHKSKYSKEQERWKPRRRDDKDSGHRRRRSHSRLSSRSRSRSPQYERHRNHSRQKDQTRSPSPKQKHVASNSKDYRHSPRRPASSASDSDPLEAIVGPLPPPPEPIVRSKGRGAYKANNKGIESRFSSTYDPTTDVRANSDAEDDWGDALEALRDRARWQQQGADRLKAAGFTDEQVRKWEKGDVRNEEDVVWTSKGQAREWDRGKVVDDEGHVELRADFGRLK